MERLRKVIASLGVVAILSTLMVTSVANADWWDTYVDELVTAGVLDSADDYRAGDKLTRAELVEFAVDAFSLEGTTEIDFSDVSASASYYGDLQTAVANGVVKGYDDGTFGPEKAVLRSELVKILVEAGGLPECEMDNPFNDIPSGIWYKEYALTAYCNSVIDGYSDGSFGGAKDTARSEAAKMVSVSMTPVVREGTEPEEVEEVESTDLEGGAGSITVTAKSTYNNEEVGEGDEEVKVMAFEVEADDSSDVEVTSVKAEFELTTGTGSDKLDQYVETVYVLFDGEVVGEADADAFSENSDVYTKFITLDDSIIRMGEESTFAIAVTSVGNLDSGDIADDDWTVDVLNVRFVDAEGVVTTETTTGLDKTFNFEDFATANNVELEADLTDDNPEEGVVIGDDSDETEVLLLSYTFTPDGTDVNIEELEFTITAGTAFMDIAAQDIILKWGDEETSESITVDDAVTEDVLFEDLDIDIDEDEEVVFEVWATTNELDGAAPAVDAMAPGETLNAALIVASTVATDGADEDLEAADLTGSADGEDQHLFTVAPEVTYVSSSIEAVDNGDSPASAATVTLVVDITALGGTVYLNGDDEYSGVEALYTAAEDADVVLDLVDSATIKAAVAAEALNYLTDPQTVAVAAAAAAVADGVDLSDVTDAMDVVADLQTLYESLIIEAVGADTLGDYEFATSGNYTKFNSGDENEYYKVTENKTMRVTITATISHSVVEAVLAGLEISEIKFGTTVTTDVLRSEESMDWSDLTDSLKTPKTTLVGE